MDGLKDLVRPPFANYDVVVYFGGGLFFIPFINRYLIEPAGLRWPKFQINIASQISGEFVSALSLLFCIYILGHILAYTSSQLIEKSVERFFGKVSSSIIMSCMTNPQNRNQVIRSIMFERMSKIIIEKALVSSSIRIIFHIPAFPIYIIIWIFGIFGYYNTRITNDIMSVARTKFTTLGLPDSRILFRSKWFKSLEYYVINRIPIANSRMYNYLVIGGLFRTLCLVFMFSLWAQLYYSIHFFIDGDTFLQPVLGSVKYRSGMIEYTVISMVYMFCLFSYIKFQRRYAEEAIFAFVFENAPSTVSHETAE